MTRHVTRVAYLYRSINALEAIHFIYLFIYLITNIILSYVGTFMLFKIITLLKL